jgi:uncharacterized metal-binding protein YceD (DUF177 family)
MVEIPTNECARCQTEFDIDEHYRKMFVSDHPHPEDVDAGYVEDDKEFILCGPCAADLQKWVKPDDIEAIQERHSNYEPNSDDILDSLNGQ